METSWSDKENVHSTHTDNLEYFQKSKDVTESSKELILFKNRVLQCQKNELIPFYFLLTCCVASVPLIPNKSRMFGVASAVEAAAAGAGSAADAKGFVARCCSWKRRKEKKYR